MCVSFWMKLFLIKLYWFIIFCFVQLILLSLLICIVSNCFAIIKNYKKHYRNRIESNIKFGVWRCLNCLTYLNGYRFILWCVCVVPQVLKTCAEFIEKYGIVDGIYRLSGITSNIQRLRLAFGSFRCVLFISLTFL